MRKATLLSASIVSSVLVSAAFGQVATPFATINSTLTTPVLSTTFSTVATSDLTGTATTQLGFIPGWDVVRSVSVSNVYDTSIQTGYNFASGTGGRFGPQSSSVASGLQLFNSITIPASPKGTQVGAILTVHDLVAAAGGFPSDIGTTTATQGIALVRTGPNPLPAGTDTFAVRFNMWGNFNTASVGTSEFAFYGLNGPSSQASIGTLSTGIGGVASAFPAPPAALPSPGVGPMTSGTTFTTTVDGGFARDLRVFNGTAEEIADANFFGKNVFDAANSPSQGLVTVSQDSGNSAYAGAFGSPTSIIPGGQWLDVVLYVSPTETSYYINGIPIYSKTSSTPLGNLFLGYMDMNSGISPLGSNTWAVYTDYQVLVVPEPTTLAVVAGVFAMALRRRRA